MARQVQLRRGTTAEHSTFIGAVGEVTVDTDKDVTVVHDGATAGGVPLLKAGDLTAGTGITVSGTTIINAAPDQTVSLTGGTGISTSGTYPSFTVTNAAPDQTVVLTEGANVTVTGTYPNFTIASTDTEYTAGTGLVLAGTEFAIGTTVVTSAYTGNVDITGNITGTQFSGNLFDVVLIGDVKEKTTVSATAATGTIAFDVLTQQVLFLTVNSTANFTVNIRGNNSTTLDSIMAVGESITAALLVTNGGTAYYNTVVQVDGATVTPKFQGGTAPDAGNASSVDIYTYTVIKTGAATFSVFASQTQFA